MQDLEQPQVAKNGALTTAFKIVVTGDIITEWRFAQSKVRNPAQHAALFDSANHMGPYVKAIGAASLAEILVRMLAGLPSVVVGEPRPEVQSPTGWGMELRTEDRYWGSYVVCAQYPKKRGNDDEVVWRIKQKLGVDRKDPHEPLINLSTGDKGDAALVVVNQSIGDDTRGFMAHWTAWPESLRNPRSDAWLLIEWSRPRLAPDTDFWKFVSAPERFGGRIVVVATVEDLRLAGLRISRGLSWERTVAQLFEKVQQLWRCDDDAPKNGPLCGCAHLVVSFETSGAVIFSKANEIVTAKLIYDPQYVEGGWAEQYEGTMSGFTRCLTAGIALAMIRARGNLTTLDPAGAKAGVIAARRVLEVGFIPIGRRGLGDTELPMDLRFPASVIARVLRSIVAEAKVADEVEKIAERLRAAFAEGGTLIDKSSFKSQVLTTLGGLEFDTKALTEELDRIYDDWVALEANPIAYRQALEDEDDIDDFDKWRQLVEQRLVDRTLLFVSPDREAIAAASKLEVASVDERTAIDQWSILDSVLPKDYEDTPAAARILEECDKVVQYGDAIRFPFPTTRFGDLFVTNRVELESLTAVRELMVNYVQSNMPTPLSIAVFGPPGSGKSFGIKQLAKGIAGGRYSRIETRTFNLSQFNGPEALAVALQQVRDDGLSGKMPLVFWDEFDTKHDGGMGWLRYFLAPMQDGKYQDGSAVYYVGRAIFVFAGGTHATMAEFIRKAKLNENEAAGYSPTAIAEKVPDFVSRLKGYVDVPPLDYAVEKNERIVIDAATALRRAYLLRSFLEDSAGDLEETVPHKQDGALQPVLRKRLNVDPGVVAAFLRVKSFRFGARSMEAIVKMSALSGKIRYDRSSLPPDNQLNLHVNAEAFVDFAKRDWPV